MCVVRSARERDRERQARQTDIERDKPISPRLLRDLCD